MTLRKSPILKLVPDQYIDLIPFFEAMQQIVQKQGEAVSDAAAATALAPPVGGSGATAGAYDNAANRDLMIASLTAVIADVDDIRTQFNALLDELQSEGTIQT